MATRRIKELLKDESGLVSTLELTIGVILSFTLIVTAVVLIAHEGFPIRSPGILLLEPDTA